MNLCRNPFSCSHILPSHTLPTSGYRCTVVCGVVQLEQVGADDEPVWRQLLQHYLDHPDPYIADEALEGLHSSSDSDSYDKSVDCGPWVELHRSLMNLHK